MRNFFARHPALKPLLPVAVLMLLVVLVAGVFVALVATGYRPSAANPTSAAATTSRAASPGSERFASASIDPGPAPVSQASQDADTDSGSVLPRTSDAATFAAAYATALFSYDTREPEAAWAAFLSAGLDQASDVHTDNVADLAARTPPAPVWQAMTASGQRATFTLSRVWIPQLWKQNASAYPAGAAAVTVSGTQHVTWSGGTSDVPSSVTLLLVCPPLEGTCVVNRIATQVLQ